MKWIYLIKAIDIVENNVYYKIGISKNHPSKRLKQLQTGNALRLEIVEMFHSKYANLLESSLHRTFSIERIREDGEWFHLTDEQIINFMINCNKIEKDFDFLNENNTFFNKNYL